METTDLDTVATMSDTGDMPALKDTSHWLTKTATAERLQTSVKTVERLISQGKLRPRSRSVPNAHPLTIFDPIEVERMALKRGINGASTALIPVVAAEAAEPARAAQMPSLPLYRKVWLSLREAHVLSGLPLAFLKESVKNGDLPARKIGRRWWIARRKLETWEP